MKRIISVLLMICLLTFSTVAIASASIFDSVTPMDENYGGAYAKLLLIPHSTTTDFFQSDIRDEAVTTYPLPHKEYLLESAKLFLIVNIPNVLILIKHFIRFLAEKLSWMGK